MLTAGRELEHALLRGPDETPARGIARNLLFGSLLGLVLFLFMIHDNSLNVQSVLGFFLVGTAILFFGWGAERLWYATVSRMMSNPFSILSYVTRIPFWYVAGGTAFTLAMLLAKKYGLLDVYDIPVKNLFTDGGRIGCVIQIPLQILTLRKLTRQYPGKLNITLV